MALTEIIGVALLAKLFEGKGSSTGQEKPPDAPPPPPVVRDQGAGVASIVGSVVSLGTAIVGVVGALGGVGGTAAAAGGAGAAGTAAVAPAPASASSSGTLTAATGTALTTVAAFAAFLIVAVWVTSLVLIFGMLSAVATRAAEMAARGTDGVLDKYRGMVRRLEQQFIEDWILKIGGQITSREFDDVTNEFSVKGVSGVAPDVLKRLVVIARVAAIQQIRGYNSAVAAYFRNQHAYSGADLGNFGVALDDDQFEGFLLIYYRENPGTTFGVLFAHEVASRTGGRASSLEFESFGYHLNQVYAEGLKLRIAQSHFVGQMAGVRFALLIPGVVSILDVDIATAAAAAPYGIGGNNLTAATNRIFGLGFRQFAELLFDDEARLGFDGSEARKSPVYTQPFA